MMKESFKKNFLFASLILIIFSFITFLSCRKKDQSCIAVITATDAAGSALSGASVHLYPNVTPPPGSTINIDTTAITDGSGKVTFKFKLQAILNCTVTYSGPPLLTGTGIVKLEPGETVEKTIIAQ